MDNIIQLKLKDAFHTIKLFEKNAVIINRKVPKSDYIQSKKDKLKQ